MAGENGKLDNVIEAAIDSHEGELDKALKGIKAEGESLKETITKMDEKKLIQVIEKNFKDKQGNWLPYSSKNQGEPSITTSPAYAFITQAAIDMLGKYDPYLDTQLGINKGIDMQYGRGTRALVKRIETCLGITVDGGYAGKEFFDAVVKCLKGDLQYDPTKAEQITSSAPAPTSQRRTNGEIPKPNPAPDTIAQKIKGLKGGDNMIRGLSCSDKTLDQKEILVDPIYFDEEFDTGEHETPGGDPENIKGEMENGFSKCPAEGEIVVSFYAGTDSQKVDSNTQKLTKDEYDKKVVRLKALIKASSIPSANQKTLLTYIDSNNFYNGKSGFTNEWLVGMRNVEAMIVAVEEYNKQFPKDANLHPKLHFNYLGDKKDEVGTAARRDQRFVKGFVSIVEIIGGNDWIKRCINDEIRNTIQKDRALHGSDAEWRDARNEGVEVDYNKKIVELKTFGESCFYDRSTNEVFVNQGGRKYIFPIGFLKSPTIDTTTGQIRDGVNPNPEIIRAFAHIGSNINKAIAEGITDQSGNKKGAVFQQEYDPQLTGNSRLNLDDSWNNDTSIRDTQTLSDIVKQAPNIINAELKSADGMKKIAARLTAIKYDMGILTHTDIENEYDHDAGNRITNTTKASEDHMKYFKLYIQTSY